ncbi:Oxygen-independent coproporphyrinogen-III oxidase [Phocoenobacter uteri]|uniref:Coproporphyrinogen-III oxidase n=1 Tax=Phocoenobacter uteri TaxID=146806 RepID=A0A379C800_9PAST|nr:oxygen-independent coproporphyrinogen III oxidase [Phocoenobacter uteri]MDG6882273.1 coproporphyrinogen III oxidase [Phocoenobacter uteri]SUB58430.1 Oxygen-independent coproporphyrinogen-III oxidase [Phocoenobacter uteri]
MNKNLIQKYNIPGPRYTSYPTVPFWNKEGIELTDWEKSVQHAFEQSNQQEGISIYIHLPFCESLCTFCACHKRISKSHDVELPYIETLLKEWDLYCNLFSQKPRIKEIHLGGGTPTFFASENISLLINGIFKRAEKCNDFELSYEAHPNHTSGEQIATLYQLGARRNSFGIQDYDPKVQEAIKRIQTFEQVEKVHQISREVGYQSISHDLIFGLPFQTESSIRDTIEKTLRLKPDRIAYYSYAHVPWVKGVMQRGFNEDDLPKDVEKRHFYELGKALLFENGYVEIGMDHFALPTDSLYKAMENKKLHRNFMGYTAGKTDLMIGLGMSSISDAWYAFAQNEKTLKAYQYRVEEGKLPIMRGHLLTEEDVMIRQHILNLMCHFHTDLSVGLSSKEQQDIKDRLKEMVKDGLIHFEGSNLIVNEKGRMFVRNICMAFDFRLIRQASEARIFSMTI